MVVSQNYTIEDSPKNQEQCIAVNEVWNTDESYCMQFENDSVISSNESNIINLDLKYTKGEFHYMLNPLYIDYYDMYFIPDDQCVLNEFGYENSTYVNYIIDNANYTIDEIETLNLLDNVDLFSYVELIILLDQINKTRQLVYLNHHS